MPTDEQYREAARLFYGGDVEIDADAEVSRPESPVDPTKGAYVQAWVWVDDIDVEEENP